MSKKWLVVFAAFLVTLPALLFYVILWRTAVNLPILDDYEIILGTTNSVFQAPGLTSKLAIVLTSQHNGYRLVFENVIVWAFHSLVGHIQILPLVALGNALALVIFLTVAFMAKLPTNDSAPKLVFLAPVAFFIFQLQYASALNFASSSLQHLAVIAFSLLAIYFISREQAWAFVMSCFTTILAVASSPNGFFLAPIGILVLMQQRQWKRIAYWSFLFVCLLAFYLYHYIPGVSGAQAAGTTSGSVSHHINLLYALSFVGSSAARYSSVLPSLFLGSLLFALFIWAAARRYFLKNPAVFYSMLFIVINGIAISALRPDLGVAQSLASRYRTYSNLMVAFSYLFILESFLLKPSNRRIRPVAIGAAMLASILFCTISDLAGARFLAEKKRELIKSYISAWQHTQVETASSSDVEAEANPAFRKQVKDGTFNVNLPILRESVRLGVYTPPDLR